MKATVIIPTKNRPTGLLRAVSSVNHSDVLSVIVVDDGSDISAAEVLRELSTSHIKVVLNKGTSGPAGARNFGVSIAETEIIFFLDDDDQLIAGYIDDVISALQGDARTADFGFSSMRSGGQLRGVHSPTCLLGAQTPLAKRLGGLGMGFWIRRKCFLDLGGIDESLRINEDTEFCIRLAKRGVIGWFSASPGVEIRPEGGCVANDMVSITSSSRATERKVAFEIILEKHGEFLATFPKVHLSFVRRVVKYNARGGNFWGALRLAKTHRVPGYQIWLDAISGALSRRRAQ